ncbi:MAG: DUF4296 domain-containing protein [Balneolaceae bacterium]|nr:DUF4296 domain-containing protein [Balneolaceae bacterium]
MSRGVTAIIALALLASISACSANDGVTPPENLIGEETYLHLLIELQLLKSYQEIVPPDSMNIDSLKKVIFNKYDVSEARFRKSHNYYQHQVGRQRQRVVRAIDSLRMEIGGRESIGLDSLKHRTGQ